MLSELEQRALQYCISGVGSIRDHPCRIDPSGTETKVVLKVSGLYQVKYLADDIVVGSVAVTVIQPPAPKALFSQTFQDSLALNTEVRIKYQVSNCGSLSSVILPGTPQRADPKTEKIVFSVNDSLLKTGSTMPVGKWQQTILLICTGIDETKADTARISFMLKVPKIEADSLSPRTAVVGIWGTHCFYSKNRTFVSNNGVISKERFLVAVVMEFQRWMSLQNLAISFSREVLPWIPAWFGRETVEYIAQGAERRPYPVASVSQQTAIVYDRHQGQVSIF